MKASAGPPAEQSVGIDLDFPRDFSGDVECVINLTDLVLRAATVLDAHRKRRLELEKKVAEEMEKLQLDENGLRALLGNDAYNALQRVMDSDDLPRVVPAQK